MQQSGLVSGTLINLRSLAMIVTECKEDIFATINIRPSVPDVMDAPHEIEFGSSHGNKTNGDALSGHTCGFRW